MKNLADRFKDRFGFVFKERVSTKSYALYTSFVTNIVQSIVIAILATALVYMTFNKKIFIQPPFIVTKTTEMDYTSGTLKEEFLDDVVVKFISFTENLTPANAEKQTAKIKPYLSQDFYKSYEGALKTRVRNLKDTVSIRNFHISSVDKTIGGEITIKGVRLITTGDTVILNEDRKIVIYYKISNTDGFQIIDIKELKK